MYNVDKNDKKASINTDYISWQTCFHLFRSPEQSKRKFSYLKIEEIEENYYKKIIIFMENGDIFVSIVDFYHSL